MTSNIDTENESDTSRLSPRDAVKREALRYFSSDPGLDSTANNISLHNQSRTVLSPEKMTLAELSKLSLELLYRNTLTDLSQKYLEVMQIEPICEFMEYNESEVSSLEARSSARDAGIATSVYKVDLFPRCRVGRPYGKPMSFLQQSLFAAGLRPGEDLDNKLDAARVIKEQEIVAYEAAVKIWSSRLDAHVPMSDDEYMRDPRREFEYETYNTSEHLYYHSATNKPVYEALEILDIQPRFDFDQFSIWDWNLRIVGRGSKIQGLVSQGLKRVEGYFPTTTGMERKVCRYIVLHTLRRDGDEMEEKLAKIREAWRKSIVVAKAV
ncbi:hypothetical protein E4T43_06304 [Aureobasidium subglaciale]|nr:hypothetical protein E4T43_06304 [Aureobasidium subglaciale]